MKGSFVAKLNYPAAIHSKLHRQRQDGRVASYSEAVSYLFETCATPDEVTRTDAEMVSFTQPLRS